MRLIFLPHFQWMSKFHTLVEKGIPTQNLMAACDFDMLFTFVWSGWEGTTHDTRIFFEALKNDDVKFSKPPNGKFFTL